MKSSSRKCLLICCLITAILLILLVVTLVILYFTMFKPKQPQVAAVPKDLRNFQIGYAPVIILRATIGLDIFVRNRNYAGFKYRNSTTSIFYREVLVGQVPVDAGEIGARSTQNISTTANFQLIQPDFGPDFVADVLSGSLNLTSTSRVEGKVVLLKIFKLHAAASVLCNTVVFIGNETASSSCASKVDF